MLRVFFRLFFSASIAFLALMAALPFLAFQNERLVPVGHANVFEDVDLAKSVLRRLNPQRMDPTRETVVRVTDDEISRTLAAVLARTLPSASAVVEAGPDGITVKGSAQTAGIGLVFGKFLNARAVVRPSASGLEFADLTVGNLSIPTWIVRPTFVVLVDLVVGFGKGSPAYDSIRRVEVKGQQIVLTFKPPAGLYDDFKTSVRRIVHRNNVPVIRVYYEKIVEVSRQLKASKQVSFASYMSSLLQLAKERSVANDPREENRALILALALYFGDSRFQMLLGEVTHGMAMEPGTDKSVVRLSGRHDWVQHFVTTAAIQVAAGSDISNFVGEAKEIVDADGPSGFSFTDIAADRAGVRFAHLATVTIADARKLQGLFEGPVAENVFFPRVSDLPEGLSAAAFKRTYTDVGSDAYDRMILAIDQRIDRLPICAE